MALSNILNGGDWLVEETGFDPDKANFHETVFTVGNGYLGTRGTLEEGHRGELSGTYLAGVYDHNDSTVIDQVNAPDWLPMAVWIAGTRLDVQTCTVVEHRRALDLGQGVLYRITLFEDGAGRRTRLESLRFASLADRRFCAIRLRVTAENHSSEVVVESAIDGLRRNLDRLPVYTDHPSFHPEVRWQKWAKSRHMGEVDADISGDGIYLEMETLDTGHRLGYAARLAASVDGARSRRRDYERVAEAVAFTAGEGVPVTLDKTVAIYTSRDVDAADIKSCCAQAAGQGFDDMLAANAAAWRNAWDTCDVRVEGDTEATRAARFNIYHLLIAANPEDPRANIGAKSLSGEGYKGHVFWDTEIFMLPFYIYAQPETAKALLLYRYHTLDGARANAKENGFAGAQYPWESADTGLETTPKWTADGKNRIWTGEEEIHVTADVAYGILTYVTATGDWGFMRDYGAEILFETSRFWASRLEHNPAKDRYELTRVIGPDEFHEHVDNNTFTNCMARWHLLETVAVYERLKQEGPAAILPAADEVARWRQMADAIHIPIDRDQHLIEQFSGYFEREDVAVIEWDENGMPCYPEGYDHFNMNDTMLVKQPDVIMLLYVLPDAFDDETKRVNYAFYEPRTLHKSSLSPAIHAIMGIEVGDPAKALGYFNRSAFVDLADNQGNTQDGIHAASAGGTWQALVFGFGGFRVKDGRMTFKPWLPEGWSELAFKLQWRGNALSVCVRRAAVDFRLEAAAATKEEIVVFGESVELAGGKAVSVPIPA